MAKFNYGAFLLALALGQSSGFTTPNMARNARIHTQLDMSAISSVKAAQTLDSNKKPQIEVEVSTEDGKFIATAYVPNGALNGAYTEAVSYVNHVLGPAIWGVDPTDQQALNDKINETEDKNKLGSKAVSAAFAKAANGARLMQLMLAKSSLEPDAKTLKTVTTKAGGNLIDKLMRELDLQPLERVALTCAGNLQMVMSSFYLEPVDVIVDLFEEVPFSDDSDGSYGSNSEPLIAVYDRVVTMQISGETFCVATSKVRIYDEEMYEMVSTTDVGIGQLIRLKNLAPRFTLIDAGRHPDGKGMWRFYSMDCGSVEFDIIEDFPADAWNIVCMK
jgi:hypothetical protein